MVPGIREVVFKHIKNGTWNGRNDINLELEIQTGRQLRRPVMKQRLNAKTNVRRNTAADTDAAQTEGDAELRDSAFKKYCTTNMGNERPCCTGRHTARSNCMQTL